MLSHLPLSGPHRSRRPPRPTGRCLRGVGVGSNFLFVLIARLPLISLLLCTHKSDSGSARTQGRQGRERTHRPSGISRPERRPRPSRRTHAGTTSPCLKCMFSQDCRSGTDLPSIATSRTKPSGTARTPRAPGCAWKGGEVGTERRPRTARL